MMNLLRFGRSIKDWPIKEELWVGKNVSITDLQHGSGPATTRNCAENQNLRILRFAETFWNLGQSWRRPSLDWGNWPRVCHRTWLWFSLLPQDLGNNYDHCESDFMMWTIVGTGPDYHIVDDKKMIANMTIRPPQIFSLPRWGRRCCPARAAPAGKSNLKKRRRLGVPFGNQHHHQDHFKHHSPII